MNRATATAALFLAFILGCASSSKDVGNGYPDQTQIPVGDSKAIGEFRTKVDSAEALYDFGDVADFLALRDSLHSKIKPIAESNPAVRSDPDFNRLLASLTALDSLDIIRSYADNQTSEFDSIALSIEPWPDMETQPAGPPVASAVDTSEFPEISNDRIDFWILYFT